MSKFISLFIKQLAQSKPAVSVQNEDGLTYDQYMSKNHSFRNIKFNINQNSGYNLKTKIKVNRHVSTHQKKRKLSPVLKRKQMADSFLATPVNDSIDNSQLLIQLNKIPIVIDLDEFRNPQTASNPLGSLFATFRFSQLANGIPSFSTYYNRSANAIDDLWPILINNASSSKAPIRSVFANAQRKYESSVLQDASQTLNTWLPVYPFPTNWADSISFDENLRTIKLDLSNPEQLTEGFDIIGDEELLTWHTDDKNPGLKTNAIGLNSKIDTIEMKIMQVDFIREWLNPTIFELGDWRIDGFNKGFYSSGNRTNNQGEFPLLPVSMLVGTKVKLSGSLDEQDRHLVQENILKKKSFSLGPFALATSHRAPEVNVEGDKVSIESNIAHVIGFISELIPLSPKEQ